MGLPRDGREGAADVQRRAALGERGDRAVRAGVPRRRDAVLVEGGEVAAVVAADAAEVAADVQVAAGDRDRRHLGVLVAHDVRREAAHGRAGAAIDDGEVVARGAADRREGAADDEVRALHGERVDLREADGDLRVRRPADVDDAGVRIDRREPGDGLPADRGEAAARVQADAVGDERVDEAAAEVGGPGRRLAGAKVERAHAVARKVRDRVRVVELVERAADVDRRRSDGERVDGVVDDARQPALVGRAVIGPDARQPPVGVAVHGGEGTADDDVARAADGRHAHRVDRRRPPSASSRCAARPW